MRTFVIRRTTVELAIVTIHEEPDSDPKRDATEKAMLHAGEIEWQHRIATYVAGEEIKP